MPLYRYRCICGRTFEAYKPMSERKTAVCECGKRATITPSLTALHKWAKGARP